MLKKQGEPAWVYGLVIIGSAIGNATGSLIAPLLRRKVREEWILAGSLVAPAIPLFFAARSYGRPLARVRRIRRRRPRRRSLASRSTACCSATARTRRAGRAFARFETRFQIVWVIGGLVAVLFFGGGRAGIFLVALVLLFGGLSYIGAVRRQDAEKCRGRRSPEADRLERGPCPFEVRAITADEVDDLLLVDNRAFGQPPRSRRPAACVGARPSSTAPVCAFDDGALVGASRAYSFELTMPGGAVRPRGRGLLGRRGADAPPAGRAQPDDRGAPRRRARAR